MYIRAIQEHTVGDMMAPELIGHVAIPHNWIEFVFHRGCSYNINSILEIGLIAGAKERKEGRQTIFFTPLNSFGKNPDEEETSDDIPLLRKVHYHSNWKHDQDAAYRIKLSCAQNQGLQFGQTKI